MCEILFGREFVAQNTVMTSLININSPLTFDSVMMGALEAYAAANQAAIISPFIVGGAMAPVSVAGTLTQVLAEVLAGVAYSRKGTHEIARTDGILLLVGFFAYQGWILFSVLESA